MRSLTQSPNTNNKHSHRETPRRPSLRSFLSTNQYNLFCDLTIDLIPQNRIIQVPDARCPLYYTYRYAYIIQIMGGVWM